MSHRNMEHSIGGQEICTVLTKLVHLISEIKNSKFKITVI
jgi:hypothetical protein